MGWIVISKTRSETLGFVLRIELAVEGYLAVFFRVFKDELEIGGPNFSEFCREVIACSVTLCANRRVFYSGCHQ